MMPREDAYCPACPNPETAFRIEDVGMKFASEGDFIHDDTLRFKVTRPAWEVVMLDHLRSRLDDDAHRRLYDLCVTELLVSGVSAEDAARNSAQAVVDSIRKSTEDTLRRSQ